MIERRQIKWTNYRVKDRKAVINDFKQVHRATNRQEAEPKLHDFVNNWGIRPIPS